MMRWIDSYPEPISSLITFMEVMAKLGEITIGRVLLQPCWSWEKSIKPIQKTETCQSPPHIQCIISGRIGVLLEDGTKEELGPGDVAMIPPGHKTWVIGSWN